ncbi:MAG: hypothetical protein H6681_04250 [Desulfobacteraceae bacterium]|nr:hypothetical protein [Desulfobacteraceae bacterium]MCB9494638.1 hypothetical protein [Desulfobacteraceae bacterium]
MKLLDKLNKKIKIRFFNKIDKAIDQVKFGLYARINNEIKENIEEPGLFAAAVVNQLFSLPPKNAEAKNFLDQNIKKIDEYIESLKKNEDVKFVLTQALHVRLKVVFDSIGSGGDDTFARKPLNNMQRRGLIMNNTEIMNPAQFIKFAKNYFNSSPEY